MPETSQGMGHAAAKARREALRLRGRRARQRAQILRAQAQSLRDELAATVKFSWPELLAVSPHTRVHARLVSMPVIEQAKGVLMAQHRCSAEEAFDLLRRASQRSNVPVRELAKLIVSYTRSRAALN